MSEFAIVSQEMQKLRTVLSDMSHALTDAHLSTRTDGSAFGVSAVAEALSGFVQSGNSRIDAEAAWCRTTAEAVSDCIRYSEETDQEWADRFYYDNDLLPQG